MLGSGGRGGGERGSRGREQWIEGAGTREREGGKFVQISERVRHVLNSNAKPAHKKLSSLFCDAFFSAMHGSMTRSYE